MKMSFPIYVGDIDAELLFSWCLIPLIESRDKLAGEKKRISI